MQVPQYILDDMIEAGLGGDCNIICTQPRRIAVSSWLKAFLNSVKVFFLSLLIFSKYSVSICLQLLFMVLFLQFWTYYMLFKK